MSFDSSWRSRCQVSPCPIHEARPVIEQLHYLRKWPAVVTLRLGMYCDNSLCGVLLMGHGPKQISVRYGGLTWELSRLWISDDIPRNAETWFISKAIRHVRRSFQDVKFIVSYADPSAGHTGTIYRAANFLGDGKTDQERKSPRFDYEANGKRYGRRSHIPDGVPFSRVPRVSKHRFVYVMESRQ